MPIRRREATEHRKPASGDASYNEDWLALR
jgi:hypothetical protein